MSIRDWPAAERPREKLLEWGASSLSDAELLAIFLRTGVSGKSAVDLRDTCCINLAACGLYWRPTCDPSGRNWVSVSYTHLTLPTICSV